jgi:hypothetical protein
MTNPDAVVNYADRFKYPLGPAMPVLHVHGAEVAHWLRALRFLPAIDSLDDLKKDCAGQRVFAGEANIEDLRFIFVFECRGAGGHKIKARGHLFFPYDEFMEAIARSTAAMLCDLYNSN